MSIETLAFHSIHPTPEKHGPLDADRITKQMKLGLGRVAMDELEKDHRAIIDRLISPDSGLLDDETREELREAAAMLAHRIATMRHEERWDLLGTIQSNWNLHHYGSDSNALVQQLQHVPHELTLRVEAVEQTD